MNEIWVCRDDQEQDLSKVQSSHEKTVSWSAQMKYKSLNLFLSRTSEELPTLKRVQFSTGVCL